MERKTVTKIFSIVFVCVYPLMAHYGETLTVESPHGTSISPGWVLVRESYSGPRIYTPYHRTKTYMTLVNLNGAPLGTTMEVNGASHIPNGWVITGRRDMGPDHTRYNIRYFIEKRFEGDFMADEHGEPVSYRPVEYDFSTLDLHQRTQPNPQGPPPR